MAEWNCAFRASGFVAFPWEEEEELEVPYYACTWQMPLLLLPCVLREKDPKTTGLLLLAWLMHLVVSLICNLINNEAKSSLTLFFHEYWKFRRAGVLLCQKWWQILHL